MSVEVKKYLDLLGLKAQDKVTGFNGVIDSICFDLYGCVQVALTPQVGTNGILQEAKWVDVNRLKITGKKPLMEVPTFRFNGKKPTSYDHGCSDKPTR